MEISISWNVTAVSFSVSSLLSAFIAWKAFGVWRKQAVNPASLAFFQVILYLFLYVLLRAGASVLFVNDPSVLAAAYVFSHVFLGLAASYIVKFSMISFFKEETARRFFYLTLLLFSLDIGLNLLYPNSPEFHAETGIIDWGTHHFVAIFHTALLWGSFLTAAALFLYKGIRYSNDPTLRFRSLLIASSLFAAILIVIPRNIVESPAMIFVSDIGFILAFSLVFFGVSFKPRESGT
ncbi:MAG: hypothetical protein Q8P12_07730 [bacterium]|nr:hypothetical protein [bacterium]